MSLAVVGAGSDDGVVSLRCEGERIVDIGPDVVAADGDTVIDAGASGLVLTPALVNAHTHAAMTLFRGYADDLALMEWLEDRIWPAEARLTDDDVYWGARLACAEMIRTGTTRFWDMYWEPGATARAVADSGLRATVGGPLLDIAGDAQGRESMARALESLEAVPGAGPNLAAALAPHAIYTASVKLLHWVGETAAEHDLPIQIHLSETEAEVEACLAEHQVRPAQLLDRAGCLGPRTMLAHSVWLDDAERALIAERGATVATNPVANLKLAVGGPFDYPAARAAGIAVALGTDGPGSNNSLDLFSDAKHFALMQKHAAADAAVVDAEEVLSIAAGARAPLLGAQPLEVGADADFLLVRGEAPELGLGGLAAGLVYGSGGSIVDTTVVAGRVLMRDGIVPDEAEVLARARECASRLGLR